MDKLVHRWYKQSKQIGIGPDDDKKLFYHHLTSIAVDYANIIQSAKGVGQGWHKLPKNTNNRKKKFCRVYSIIILDGRSEI